MWRDLVTEGESEGRGQLYKMLNEKLGITKKLEKYNGKGRCEKLYMKTKW